MTTTIDIADLNYTYVNRSAPSLRDVSLIFDAGVSLIVGRSGSGKTTLVRCINGLIPHIYKQGTLTGRVRCFGDEVRLLSLSQLARRIGTVMQDPDKQIVATRVYNEIAFGLENLGLPPGEIRSRVSDAASRLRIAHLLGRDTHTLSGGELQKVVIAAVLAMQPRALVLDEPLSSLDPPSAREALALFRRLADEGMIVLLVEHRVGDALRIAPDRCIALQAGEVVFAGDAAAYRAWRDGRRKMEDDSIPLSRPSAAAAELVLSFRNVSFAYPNASCRQVDDVTFDVRAGDVIALMGPNGAGKSTLCKMAIGLIRPQQGRVVALGADVAALTVAQAVRLVGYVFQHPAVMLFANTLREELSFGPRNVGLDEAQTRAGIAAALETVGLSDLALDTSPFALSFGQQKRLALAGVLAMQPRVLILDEPTAGLDDGTAEALMHRLLASRHGPEAVLMVTHDLNLARRFANRVILMADGRIVADGPPAAVLADEVVMRQAKLFVEW